MTTSLLLESRKVCINKTRCSCHNRQAASAEKLQLKAAKSYPPLVLQDPSKTQSPVGTALCIYTRTAPRQPGANQEYYCLKKR